MNLAVKGRIDNDEYCYGQHLGLTGMTEVVEGGGGERASFAFPKDAPKLPEEQETKWEIRCGGGGAKVSSGHPPTAWLSDRRIPGDGGGATSLAGAGWHGAGEPSPSSPRGGWPAKNLLPLGRTSAA